MRLIVQRDELIKELELLRPLFVERLGMSPNVLLSAANGRFSAMGTDNWSWMTTGGEATVVRPGELRVKADHFLSLIKELPKGELTLDSERSDAVTLTSADFTAKLLCSMAFARPNVLELDGLATVKSERLLALIRRTSSVMTDDDARGKVALLAIRKDGARMVTTDGHRLAVSDQGQFEGEGADFILPRKTIARLKAMMDGYRGDVLVNHKGNDLLVTVGHRVLQTKQGGTSYPPYERVLPGPQPITVEVDPVALASAARRTVLMLRKQEEAILTLNLTGGGIKVEANGGKEEGLATEFVEAAVIGTTDHELRIRAAYLMDALYNIESDRVKISCTDTGLKPVTIEPTNEKTIYVIMPIAKERQKVA